MVTKPASVPNDPSITAVRRAPTPLVGYLSATYALIIIYASLYPFAHWRMPAVDVLAFLAAPWPRYITHFDIAANIAAYVPLGALLVACLPYRLRPILWRASIVLLAGAAGALLSIALETVQNYLPSRVPSNVDVVLNTIGTLAGALLVAIGQRPDGSLLHLVRVRWFRAGAHADAGLALLGLWLFSQLNPEALLFGTGDLRNLFAAVPHQVLAPDVFVRVEALVSGANLVAIGLIAGALVRPERHQWQAVTVLIGIALAIRSIAFAVLAGPDHAFVWLTPGALLGLPIGGALAIWGGNLAFGTRLVLAGVLMMAATAIVNFAPGNPYLAAGLATWRQGHFLNFNGLTWAVSAAWPFAALAFLLYATAQGAGRDRREDRDPR